MKLYMIRHGATKGNREKRYVGSTDESLLEDAAAKLRGKKLPPVEEVYVSPLKRCRETAAILYPAHRQIVVEDFRECDFGAFEYKNYEELNGDPDYQRFIDSMGRTAFPGGEDRNAFQKRCVAAFQSILAKKRNRDIALVVHGGTIMALLDWYSHPHQDYFSWQTGNGSGFVTEVEWDRETGDIRLTKAVPL